MNKCPRCKKEHSNKTKYCDACITYQYRWKRINKGLNEPLAGGYKRYKENIEFLLGEVERLQKENNLLKERGSVSPEV